MEFVQICYSRDPRLNRQERAASIWTTGKTHTLHKHTLCVTDLHMFHYGWYHSCVCCGSDKWHLCRYATPKILDQLLAGESSIDVDDWQKHSLYKQCTDQDKHVQWFWSLLHSFDQSQLQALLAFVTCTWVPPIGMLLLPLDLSL